MLAVVNFHYIRDSFKTKYPGIYGQTPSQFRSQLKELSTIGTFISANQLKKHITENTSLPEKAILITFDDGLQEQYTKALPILNELNIPAVFFVNTKPIAEKKILNVHKIHILRTLTPPEKLREIIEEKIKNHGVDYDSQIIASKAKETYRYDTPPERLLKYLLNFHIDYKLREKILDNIFFETFGECESEMCQNLYFSKEQIKELADSDLLGCHSHSHYPIGLLSPKERTIEIGKSKNILEEITRKKIFAFSFPYGSKDASRGSAKTLKKCGFVLSFTMERAFIQDFRNPFYISRFDTNDVPGGKHYNCLTSDFFTKYGLSKWKLN